ncbi:hypothetical protein MNBD_ALPHA11-135 [hydrothermal vent metagenome]|uniref:DUF2853 family protein n=1 Tax=hydrothermal vent metagenome TaxID=652676 RepID=A0A3B0UG49_9ZZZZ
MSDRYLKYVDGVKKYASDASDEAVRKIVAYCGIALQSKDASLVSCSDPDELARVRKGWCTKKLGLSAEDADAAIAKTCEQMKGDRQKSRVAFYYLVAQNSGTLDKVA